ncbi:ketopantoate reductase family protein [Streptomyces sp. NPDC058664]|uniref:ketopantoate reductase family protein n=1 Tax=unclassified Streptomyces TaxID=2593676 RepID=UPI00364C12D9
MPGRTSPSWSVPPGRPRRASAGRGSWAGTRSGPSPPRLVTAGALATPYDLVLLSVKSTGLAAAIEDVAPVVGPDTAVVPLLNGLAHIDALNARFGARAVLGGVAKVVTALDDSGDIRRLAPPAHLAFGEQDGTVSARVSGSGRSSKGRGSTRRCRRTSSRRCG